MNLSRACRKSAKVLTAAPQASKGVGSRSRKATQKVIGGLVRCSAVRHRASSTSGCCSSLQEAKQHPPETVDAGRPLAAEYSAYNPDIACSEEEGQAVSCSFQQPAPKSTEGLAEEEESSELLEPPRFLPRSIDVTSRNAAGS